MYQNLHCHTTTSDGELNYKQALDACEQNNISIVAFTDHDAVPDIKSMNILQQNRNHFTKWIIGCEISSGWPKEIGGPASNFHIVGLFLDPSDKNLCEHCEKARQGRIQRMEIMVSNLQDLGFSISKDDCLKESSGKTVGRPHIVAALRKKEKNLGIINHLKMKMAQAARYDRNTKQKYEEMVNGSEDQYPYYLFLGTKAFIPDIFVDYLYYKDMDESVRLIREAGGVAILAHWTFSKHIVDQKMIEGFFREKRLDGAEIVFGGDKAVDPNNNEVRNDMEIMEKLTKRCGVLQGGGGDSHRKQDFNIFTKNKWFAEKTIGLIEEMMKKTRLNLQYSSL